jgi:signal transduction histidine kinase
LRRVPAKRGKLKADGNRELRERMRELERRAAEAEEIRDLVISMISHELRTPLHAVGLGLDVTLTRARGGAKENDWLVDKLTKSRRAVTRLEQLIESLLTVSQLAAGRLHLVREDVDLGDVVNRVVDSNSDELKWAGCRIDVSLSGALVGQWDRARLALVVQNLLSNAMKYGPGQPVEVRAEGTDRAVTLTVTDHGPGIAREHHDRIFGKFDRLPSDTRMPGLGLGLWLVRQFVEAMGGRIEVRSAEGRGASFVVTFPR